MNGEPGNSTLSICRVCSVPVDREKRLSCSTRYRAGGSDLIDALKLTKITAKHSHRLTDVTTRMLTSPRIVKCAPVAQWIEHLPCWSLNGKGRLKRTH